jgi:hypothetical protein
MKKWNGIILYFIIVIHLLQCSNAETKFDKLESEIESESENFLKNKLVVQMCGGFKEGRLNLISIDSKKKVIANPIFVNFNSDSFNMYNIDKKSLIKSFKTNDLRKINKKPVYRPVSKDQEKNCFEIVFKNNSFIVKQGKNQPKNKSKLVPITLCASNEDQKLNFLKSIVNKKQCQLNELAKSQKNIDRQKKYKNKLVIQKALNEKKKNAEKLKVPDNFVAQKKNPQKSTRKKQKRSRNLLIQKNFC